MSSPQKRQEAKRKRREKRKGKADPISAQAELVNVIRTLKRHFSVPEPKSWPGACHPSLARPDDIKYEMAKLADAGVGKELRHRLERQLENGPLGHVPDIDHWGMEEFFWHGSANPAFHPIDAYLRENADRFPIEAREQIAGWKQARIGIYEIGGIKDDTVALREWDGIHPKPVGEWMRAISLNIGGVNIFQDQVGKFAVSHLSPWAPAENLHCLMGYSLACDTNFLAMWVPFIRGLRKIETATMPLPWLTSQTAERSYSREWRSRDWVAWMRQTLRFPFMVSSRTGRSRTDILEVDSMTTKDMAEFRSIGVHFACRLPSGDPVVLGGTLMEPIDCASPAGIAFAEYRAYRKEVGPPRGV